MNHHHEYLEMAVVALFVFIVLTFIATMTALNKADALREDVAALQTQEAER